MWEFTINLFGWLFTDVVTAYKGLLKEKEALEASFKAVNNAKETSDSDHAASDNDLPKAQSKG